MQILSIILPLIIILFFGWCILIMPARKGHPLMDDFIKYRYAHRGYHDIDKQVPENSMFAFQRALNRGFAIEIDVRLTNDGRLAVIHDSKLERLCGEGGKVEKMNSEELEACRLENTSENIPFLEDVLKLFEGKLPILIELKTTFRNYARLTEKTCKLLELYKTKCCIASFDPRVLLWLRRNKPDIMRGQFAGYLLRRGIKSNPILDWGLHNLLTNIITRPHFIAHDYRDRNSAALRLCRKLYGVQEFSWTIKDKRQLDIVENDGAVAIFEQFDPRDE